MENLLWEGVYDSSGDNYTRPQTPAIPGSAVITVKDNYSPKTQNWGLRALNILIMWHNYFEELYTWPRDKYNLTHPASSLSSQNINIHLYHLVQKSTNNLKTGREQRADLDKVSLVKERYCAYSARKGCRQGPDSAASGWVLLCSLRRAQTRGLCGPCWPRACCCISLELVTRGSKVGEIDAEIITAGDN